MWTGRAFDGKKAWGAGNGARQELDRRDRRILDAYLAGEGIQELAEKYFLSIKSIQRILRQQKRQA